MKRMNLLLLIHSLFDYSFMNKSLHQQLTTLLLGLLLPALFCLTACNGTDDDFNCDRRNMDDTAEDAAFSFRYENSEPDTFSMTGGFRSPLDGLNYPCFRDSVVILKEDSTAAVGFSLSTGGRVRFRVTTLDEDHSDAFVNEQVRTFYLYVNHLEIDTFRFEYKMLRTDCGYTPFEYVRGYLNDDFLFEVNDQPRIGGTAISKEELSYNPCPD